MRWLILAGLIFCAGGAWAHGPGGGAPDSGYRGIGEANVATDTDGDGDPDTLTVRGDFNNDGAMTPKDIDDAIWSLTDTGPKTVTVEGGVYTMGADTALDWDDHGSGTDHAMVSMQSNTTLSCRGTVIQAWTTATPYSTAQNAYILSNESEADTPGNDNMVVEGCTFDSPILRAPYDASAWASEVINPVYIERARGFIFRNNRVLGGRHTCIYVRESIDVLVEGNYAQFCGGVMNHAGTVTTLSNSEAQGSTSVEIPNGQGASYAAGSFIGITLDNGHYYLGWVMAVDSSGDPDVLTVYPGVDSAATAGNAIWEHNGTPYHAIYFYADDGIIGRREWAIGNTIDGNGATSALHARADTNAEWHEGVKFSNNLVSRSAGRCFDIMSVRGGEWSGNVCDLTTGMEYLDSQASNDSCAFSAADANCSTQTVVSNNILRNNGWASDSTANGAILLGRGHARTTFTNNEVRGTANGHCMGVWGDYPNSVFDHITLADCADRGFQDGNSALTVPMVFSNLTIRNVSRDNITAGDRYAVNITQDNRALSFPGLRVSGCAGSCVRFVTATGMTGVGLSDFEIDATHTGFLGRMAEATANGLSLGATDFYWVLINNASGTSDCTFSASTGASENACYWTGSAWSDFSSNITNDWEGLDVVIGAGDTMTDFYAERGSIMNVPDGRSGVRIQGAGTATRPRLRNINVSQAGGSVASGEAMGNGFRIDVTTLTGALFSGNACGGNVTTCVTTDLDDDEIGASSVVQSTATPDEACTTGAIWQDINTTSQGFYVCDNSAWVDVLP